MRTTHLPPPSLRERLLFLSVWLAAVLQPSLEGAGIAAYKEQPYHKDEWAVPIVYAAIVESPPPIITFDMGNEKRVTYDRPKIVAHVEVPALPANIAEAKEVEFLQSSLKAMAEFARQYSKSAELLKPHIDHFTKALDRINGGEVRSKGEWMTRGAFALTKQENAQRDAALNTQLLAKQKERDAFEKSQRAKGLENYKGQWLPAQDVLVALERDRQDAIEQKDAQTRRQQLAAIKKRGGMDAWIGEQKSDLLKAWGVANRTASDGKGGEILIYEQSRTYTVGNSSSVGVSSVTVVPDSNSNSISGFGLDATSGRQVVKQATITEYREVFVTPDGVIYYWRTGTR